MFRRILVPLDGSELAERALQPALALARPDGGELILLRVPVMERILMPTSDGYGLLWPDQSVEQSQKEATEYLARVQKRHQQPGFALRTLIAGGDGAGGIVDAAAAEKVDLIVMSTHGYSGLTRWMLGSVTERVLHSAACPVLVVRSAMPVRRVVITLDGSELSEQALKPGFELAAQTGSAVMLLRAIPEVPAHEVERLDEIEPGLGKRFQEDLFAEAETYLKEQVEHYALPGVEVTTRVMFGPAAYSIVKFAELESADVIVMATHGRTGLRRWAYGSVTEKVMRGAPCDILVVRPAEHQLR
jgi:nucleotide-binding universal stress UspA family protein